MQKFKAIAAKSIVFFNNLVRTRPGLVLLIGLLSIITAGMIKPEFYFVGWDNFSSYLNPSSNFFNTFFATWREHRGLGVPSDAEVNDIYRQMFNASLSLFMKREVVDQWYMASTLWGGVLGMYALGRLISKKLHQNLHYQEVFGFVAAFFYLFNLSTLAVYYFPMMMYNTRFFMLPTTIYVLLRFIDAQHLSLRTYFFYIFLLLVGFGCFMVPTIYIVFFIMLALMVIFLNKTKRLWLVLALYIGLGAYWILPFANYTIQKSSIVPQAPTFIEINEAMLNKPKSYYVFERQAKLRPSFFESTFYNYVTNTTQPFHELATNDEAGMNRWILWFFPAMYLIGSAFVFIRYRNRMLMWLSTTALLFLLFSMKEFSPFGFMYGFMADHIPFVNTIFRFGDTKFHAMIAFPGSLIAAFFVTQCWFALLDKSRKQVTTYALHIVAQVIIALHIVAYASYFTGNMVGFFMYNKIPQAYFDMAQVINDDPEAVRVIQLPYDEHSYWKPYSWGYFGSSFLHFMINKPLFDRSFEPASMENAGIHKQVMDTLRLASSVSSDAALDEDARDLYELMKSLSIRYVIDDQTVTTDVDARGVQYWGTIPLSSTHILLTYLEKKGYVTLIKHYEIDANQYVNDYAQLYPYTSAQSVRTYTPRNIDLYMLTETRPHIELVSSVNVVNSKQDMLPQSVRTSLGAYIQSPKYDARSLFFPFVETPHTTQVQGNGLVIDYPVSLDQGRYTFSSVSNAGQSTRQYGVFLQKKNTEVVVYIDELSFPTVVGAIESPHTQFPPLAIPTASTDYEFIRVGDAIFSTKDIPAGAITYLGSVIVRENTVPIQLVYPHKNYDLSKQLVQREASPQCLGDGLDDAQSHITGDGGILTIAGQNVTNCLTTEVVLEPSQEAQYAQLTFFSKGMATGIVQTKKLDTSKLFVREQSDQLSNPVILSVCIKPEGSVDCLNNNMFYQLSPQDTYITVPFSGDLTGIDKLLITFQVRSNQWQTYETKTSRIMLTTYTTGETQRIPVDTVNAHNQTFYFDNKVPLQLEVPLATSDYTSMTDFARDGILIRRDDSCDDVNKFQNMKKLDNGALLSFVLGCRNFVSKTIPFSSTNFYTWTVSYQHLSGEMPSVILMDKFGTYYFAKVLPSRVSVNDYFSIPLQRPDSMVVSKNKLSEVVSSAPIYHESGYIKPNFNREDNKNKDFIIQHHSQNEGIISLERLSLVELPNHWPESWIQPETYNPLTFSKDAENITYKRILPSLWKVNITAQQGNYMILFNEQYDSQWIPLSVKTIAHMRCNSYSNCYQIILDSNGTSTFYLFYVPELASLIGWLVTGASIVFGFRYLVKRSHASSEVFHT